MPGAKRGHEEHKRPKLITRDMYNCRAYYIPKSQWIDLYFDLYHQTIDDNAEDSVIMMDAEQRAKLLKKV